METRLAPFAVPSSTLGKVFLHHPALGETYWQHQRRALHFGASMITAGVACILHALIPAAFVRTASRTISRVHDEMQAAGRLSGIRQDRSNPWNPEAFRIHVAAALADGGEAAAVAIQTGSPLNGSTVCAPPEDAPAALLQRARDRVTALGLVYAGELTRL